LANRPSQLPAERPGAGNRPGAGGGGTQINRPSQLPAGGQGIANRPGAGGGGSQINRPSQLPAGGQGIANRPGAGGGGSQWQRPENRPNWGDWSQNRSNNWQQRVDNRSEAWNQRSDNRQQRRNDFQQNRDQRWDNLNSAREDRQNWRDETREDWQNHREDLWEYRGDRAEEIWDNASNFYDDVFDDHWWGSCGWGYGWGGSYVSNPWWWWAPAAWGAVSTFVDGITPDPVYVDYGMNVNYEGDTVYVDNQPVPAAQYSQPMINLAVNVEQPPPPLPSAPAPAAAPAAGAKPAAAPAEEWMPLGVFALAQEEKGDPIMIFQISVNRAGLVSGGYSSTLTDDQRPIAGEIDKASQQVAWRIGDNTSNIFVTSLANLTKDVAPITIHFGESRTQTWLLVRMPEPAQAGKPAAIPEIDRKPPPLKKTAAAAPQPAATAPKPAK
jgi:hypothetical protein